MDVSTPAGAVSVTAPWEDRQKLLLLGEKARAEGKEGLNSPCTLALMPLPPGRYPDFSYILHL